MSEAQTPNAAQLAGTVEIDDLDKFVKVLTSWHQSKVAMVQHLLNLPEGSVFTVGEGEETKLVTLTGDVLAGFKFGIEMSLMQLGTLPFAVEFEDAQLTAEPS